ncbi:MAG: hypothetical protein B6244_06780 [Candidatus Cloacimonetes bacterium 4572_55]|nr:MAG: hypothetical protein B6244_06780 [Candidatus Cloacimonetes bacterium 4572_55]
MKKQPIKVLIIDLYNNEENQGMGCLKTILKKMDRQVNDCPVKFDVFETRYKGDIPGLDYDIYISSGGPGSPYDGLGTIWERNYFDLINKLWNHNQKGFHSKKYVFFICHSFELMCRFFDLARVTDRHSTSFGIFPVHKTNAGKNDPLLKGLADPFYGADFRAYQVIQPNHNRMKELGATVLALEKIRPHVPYERAIMGVRISDNFVGFQFHPEAEPISMGYHFRQPHRKEQVVKEYGEAKYNEMIDRLEQPNYILKTYNAILPTFLRGAITKLRPENGR